MKSTTSIKQEVGSQHLNVTFSSGIAMLNPDENIDSLIYRSDQALYEAKSRGKNCYVVSDPDLSLGTHK
jgi:PleD family two-component response regulator